MTNPPVRELHVAPLALGTALSLAVAIRFWRGVFSPPEPFIMNFTPVVYWAPGMIVSAWALQVSIRTRAARRTSHRWAFIAINGLCFSSYLAVAMTLLVSAWQVID